MSAPVPPRNERNILPAQDAPRIGAARKKRTAAPMDFVAALLSVLPAGNVSGSPGSKRAVDPGSCGSAEPLEKRPEKEIRRKERIGKASREAAPAPAGTKIAPVAFTDPAAAVSEGSAVAPDLVASGLVAPGLAAPGVPAAVVAAGVIASGSDRVPSSRGISADPGPARASTRPATPAPGQTEMERPQPSPQRVQEDPRRAVAPSGPRAKRPDGNPLNRHIAADRGASLFEKGTVPPPHSPEADRPAKRPDGNPVNRHIAADRGASLSEKGTVPPPLSRENVAAASVLHRFAPPADPQAKRPDGNPVNRHTVADLDASLPKKGTVPPPLSPEADRPAADVRTEPARQKKPPVETSRENAVAASILHRPAPPAPGGTEIRSGETVPNGFAPGADSPRKPGSGKTGTGREELPRKEAGPASAGTEPAERPEGKGLSGSAVASARGAAELRPDAPDRGVAQVAGAGDPAKGGAFSGLSAAAFGAEPGTQSAGPSSAPTPGAPPREAPTHVPLFEQVAMKMTPLPDGAHDVEIRLAPEHLGKLKIELHIDSGRIDASVHADNPEARALLLREEPALREALRNAGVTLSSFNVALSGEPWRERKGGAQPNGDADSAPRRGRKEEPTEGVTSVHVEDVERDGMNRTEHWIA